MTSRYEIEDYSDDDGGDFIIWETLDGVPYEVGRHFLRAEAETQLADLRYVEDVDR